MDKIEALKYIFSNYNGYDGGYQFACLRDLILEDKETYTKNELDILIKDMVNY